MLCSDVGEGGLFGGNQSYSIFVNVISLRFSAADLVWGVVFFGGAIWEVVRVKLAAVKRARLAVLSAATVLRSSLRPSVCRA